MSYQLKCTSAFIAQACIYISSFYAYLLNVIIYISVKNKINYYYSLLIFIQVIKETASSIVNTNNIYFLITLLLLKLTVRIELMATI